MEAVAVIGVSPKGWRGAARFGRFGDFQRQVGELGAPESGAFWGGHAVCHGLMNGVPRVVYAAVEDAGDAAQIAGAMARLRGHGPLAAVVVPGGGALAWAAEVVAAWESLRRDAGGALLGAALWLDAPDDGAGPQGVLAFARALGASSKGVGVVGPWVPTQSPGCWRPTRLPGSCLISPLWLGATERLKGAHDLAGGARLDPMTQAELEAVGAAWLSASGVRGLVGLQTPSPRRADPDTDTDREVERPPVTLDERIRAATLEASQAALDQGLPQGPRLWKQIERRAYSALMAFAERGEVIAFDLRCDAETNDGSAQPVVSVQYRTPQRVQRLSIRVGAWG